MISDTERRLVAQALAKAGYEEYLVSCDECEANGTTLLHPDHPLPHCSTCDNEVQAIRSPHQPSYHTRRQRWATLAALVSCAIVLGFGLLHAFVVIPRSVAVLVYIAAWVVMFGAYALRSD